MGGRAIVTGRERTLLTAAEIQERIADDQYVLDNADAYDVEARVDASRSKARNLDLLRYAARVEELEAAALGGAAVTGLEREPVDALVETLRETGFCEAMREAEGHGGIAEEKQCWQRRLKRENWCSTCDERTTVLDALAARLEAAERIVTQARRVDRVYEGLRTDESDGSFALWSVDDLVRELHRLGDVLREQS